MKIVIYNQGDDLEYIGKFTNVDFSPRLVCSVGFLKHILSENPNEDIHGIILPTASKNSEFFDILKKIYEHKKMLYENNSLPTRKSIHLEFALKMYREYRVNFP